MVLEPIDPVAPRIVTLRTAAGFGFRRVPFGIKSPNQKPAGGLVEAPANEPHHGGSGNRCQKPVQPVHQAAVAGNELACVLCAELPLDRGFKQIAAFGNGLLTIHWARGVWGIVRNLRKNTFAFLNFNWVLSVLAILGVVLVHLGLYVGIIFAPGWAKLGFAAGLLSLSLFYVGIDRHLKISPLYVFLHPLSSALMCLVLAQSTYYTLKNGGIEWRGTRYPLEELRKGLV